MVRPTLARRTLTSAREPGADRAERGAGSPRPSNLIRVMPAQGAARAPEPAGRSAVPGSSAARTTDGDGIGLAIAWQAALRGLTVIVLDPAPGSGASHAAAGMLAPVTEVHYGEERLLRLNLASAQRYPTFAAELTEATGRDVGYRQTGTLAVATDADDRAVLADLHRFQLSLGLTVELLTSREARRLEPMLAPGIRSGLLVAGDHQVDNRLLATALLAAVVT